MDQEMMQLKHELKEFVEKANHILQKMDGSMGQRFYGMRGGSGYGNSSYSNGGGPGGGYGNREPWMQGGYPQQEQWPNVDPRWFM